MSLRHIAAKDRAKHDREVAGSRSCLGSLIKFFVLLYLVGIVFVMIVGILYPS